MAADAKRTDGDARRLRKPSWRDPRLLIGILLVVASVAGVVALVSSLDKSVAMFVAKDDISLGEKVEPSRLSVVEVRLDGTAEGYATAADGIREGSQANTLIKAGELVPLRALVLPDTSGRKPVTIELQQSLPQAIAVGSRVDVWSGAKEASTNSYAQPELLLPGAEVSALRPLESGFGGTAGVVVEVLVEDDKLGQLLNALANDARITVVYNPDGRKAVTVAVVVWGDSGGVTDSLERLRGTVTVVRRCEELTEVVALAETGLADAALLAGDPTAVDAATLDSLLRLGVPALVLTDDLAESARLTGLGASVEAARTGAQSISDLLELLCGSAVRGGASHAPSGSAVQRNPAGDRSPGRILVVWGPPGASGRTTVAVNLAVEAALDGQDVVLLDADTYGASVAVHLGLLDESAGIAQLCRLADQGVLDRSGFERACSVLAVAGARIRVATGLPRPSRWPELRAESMARMLDFARRQADLLVVDVAPFVEVDEDLTFDTSAPQRNGATAAALEAADDVLAVGAADSVGVPRLVKAIEEMRERFPDIEPRIAFNKVRSSSIGASPERQLRETWDRFGPEIPVAGFLPWDPEAADAALLAGSVLAESAPASGLRTAIAGLVGVGIPRRSHLFRR